MTPPPACPKCQTPMESKGNMTDYWLRPAGTIWKCPQCKHIDVKFT